MDPDFHRDENRKDHGLGRDLFYFQFGVRLAVAAVALVARLAMELDDMDLFALAVLNDRSGHLGALNERLADLHIVAVCEKHDLKINLVADIFAGQKLNFKQLAFFDEILFSAGFDDCEIHS